MSSSAPHPDFVEHPNHRWRAPLRDLLPELRRRVDAGQAGARVVLPGGAWVGFRMEDDRGVVGIWRNDRFMTADGESKWASEVLTFARMMGLLDWERTTGTLANGGPLVTFRERARMGDFFSETV